MTAGGEFSMLVVSETKPVPMPRGTGAAGKAVMVLSSWEAGVRLILGWFVLVVAVVVAVLVVPGIEVDWSPGVYWLIAAVFAVVNVTLGVVLRLVSLPLMVVTLGLFSLVVNAILLLVTDWLMDSLHVDSFWAALVGSAIIAVVAAGIEAAGHCVGREPSRTR